MRYTTVFFDLDDTLVDTIKNNREALFDIYEEYNFKKYFSEFDDFYIKFQEINLNLWDLYAHNRITKETLKAERFIQTLKDFKVLSITESLQINDRFLEMTGTKKNVIEGAKDILDYLCPKYKIFILSNGFREVQYKKIENADLKPYFEKIILSDHVGKNKPHPLIFEYAMNEANVTNRDCIMIGDNINTDIMGARNCKIEQIWYNPNNQVDDMKIAPTYIINNLKEIRNIL